jgi:hypothetical protein
MKIKICGHCQNEKLSPERRAELTKRFEEYHSMGAEKFGWDWVRANGHAADAAHALEISVTDPRIRALLSLACFRILSAIIPPKETKS